MKRPSFYNLAPLVALAWFSFAPGLFAQASDWKKIQNPPLHAFHPQMPTRSRLNNGMVIFLQEDHELPLIRGTARIRGGSRDEPGEKVGLVNLYGQSWRTSGTKKQTGDQLDDYLEARAAKVETSGGVEFTTISWDCVKDNLEDVFKVFVELLRDAEFRDEKIALAKTQANTGISRRNDNPFQIAFREAAKLVYGPDSPYGRVPEYATVAAVTRNDLVEWHHAHVHPNNIVLGVVGDFDSKTMERRLREAFEAWPSGPAAPKVTVTFHSPKAGIYFIEKDDVTASLVQLVDVGTTRDNPDYYAIEVFDEFFGGSFSSRLFSNIRSKKGLAYAVGGGIGTDFDHPGLTRLFLGTKSKTTAASIDAFNAELDALDTKPATHEELTKAQDAILNSFVFRFDSKEKVLQEQMTYEFFGYPADFLERYRAGIEKVTEEDVARVAHRYIHKDRLALLVVGKASDFDKPLSSFGPVTTLDISIPPLASARKTASGSGAEGKALLGKVIEGMGGEAKIRSVKAVRQRASLVVKTPQGEMGMEAESLAVFPDRAWQKMGTPMGEMSMVVTPISAFMTAPMGTRDMPASQKDEMLKTLKREPLFVAQHADDPKFKFSTGGKERVGEVEAQILDVDADGAEVRWYIDPASGRILRASWQSTGMRGPDETVADYADWKSVHGVSVPFKETHSRGGERESSLEIKEFEINPPLDPKMFEKPAAQSVTAP